MIPSSAKPKKTQRAKATVQDGCGDVSGILHLQNLHDDLGGVRGWGSFGYLVGYSKNHQ